MIEIHSLEDRHRWNGLITTLPTADLRQSYEWGEIRRRYGWTPLRLAALDDGECVAALSVLSRWLPGVGTVAYAPRGPALCPEDKRGWAALPALVDAVRETTRAVFLRVSPGLSTDHWDLTRRLAEAGFVELRDFWSMWNTPRNVMRLAVTGSESELLAAMARKRRQHISTAAKKGVTSEIVTDRAALREVYAVLSVHAARHRYPIRDWSYFETLHDAFAPAGAFGMAVGRVHGVLASALIGVGFGATAYALSAPSSDAARGVPVGDAVHWTWIRWARSAGCREIDFGSSGTHVPPRATDGNLGIYRFKEELGARLMLNVGYHDRVFRPARYRLARLVELRVLPGAWHRLARLPVGMRAALARRVA